MYDQIEEIFQMAWIAWVGEEMKWMCVNGFGGGEVGWGGGRGCLGGP